MTRSRVFLSYLLSKLIVFSHFSLEKQALSKPTILSKLISSLICTVYKPNY